MESQSELEKTKNAVLRKIGRNMLLFQKMEHLLKYLTANGNLSGYINELEANKKKRAEAICKKTLGQLVGDYVENTYSPTEKISEEPKELTGIYVQLSIRLGVDENFYEAKKKALAAMVAERNELVHNFLPQFTP